MKNKLPNMSDTICAICTPPGIGSIAVIRLSGVDSHKITKIVFQPHSQSESFIDRKATFGNILRANKVIDQCLCIFFYSPGSLTGEDVVEIQTHGGPIVPNLVLKSLTDNGARIAEPGEFTYRSFINGKIDLLKAEAISSLIKSHSESAAKCSIDQLSGSLRKKLNKHRDLVISLLAQFEAMVDFPEENIPEPTKKAILSDFNLSIQHSESILNTYESGRLYMEGLQVLIMGQPNVGKSTLMNRMLDEDRSIVSNIPGTTRDILDADIFIDGVRCNFFDTAGLRDSKDPIENIGIKKAFSKIDASDLILLLLDKDSDYDYLNRIIKDVPRGKILHLINKSDLMKEDNKWGIIEQLEDKGLKYIEISAKKGKNLDLIRKKILEIKNMDTKVDFEEGILTTERQVEHLKKGLKNLKNGKQLFIEDKPIEIITIEIREYLNRIGEITGETTNEEVYDVLFSKFCIGK